jgi:outer membrane protein TolC
MKTLLTLALLTIMAQAFDLPELLDQAQKNERVQAYVDRYGAAKLTYDATKSAYLPRVDLGASGSFIDEKGSLDPGETYKAYAEANFVILDGFKRENLFKEQQKSEKASEFDLKAYKKALSLQVITLYFDYAKVNADIEALKLNRKQLEEQLDRFKLFYGAGIATDEDVQRLNAAVANAEYETISQQYQLDTLQSQLELLSGMTLKGVPEKREIFLPQTLEAKTLDALSAMRYRADALGYKAEQVDSSYYPTITLHDTYTFYQYENFDPAFPVDFVDKQNRLTLMLSMNLFDFSTASQQRQAIKLQQHAYEQELLFSKKSAEADKALALKAISRAKALLEAAKKSKEASDKTFEVVKTKYENRIVDYIRYLDALTKATEARAQYNRAISGLNSAHAAYIYNLGEDPKEYVQ